jgi:hypothetical protein
MNLGEVGYKGVEQDYFYSEMLLTGGAAGGWKYRVGSPQRRETCHIGTTSLYRKQQHVAACGRD